jgi:hypothetical protein
MPCTPAELGAEPAWVVRPMRALALALAALFWIVVTRLLVLTAPRTTLAALTGAGRLIPVATSAPAAAAAPASSERRVRGAAA